MELAIMIAQLVAVAAKSGKDIYEVVQVFRDKGWDVPSNEELEAIAESVRGKELRGS